MYAFIIQSMNKSLATHSKNKLLLGNAFRMFPHFLISFGLDFCLNPTFDLSKVTYFSTNITKIYSISLSIPITTEFVTSACNTQQSFAVYFSIDYLNCSTTGQVSLTIKANRKLP